MQWLNHFIVHFPALTEKLQSGDNTEGPSVQLLKEALINTRQHEAFLRVILVHVHFYTFCVYWEIRFMLHG